MKNVLEILSRDLKRLLKAPAALIVVLALICIPSLYTWVNVIGFWNPYENTGNLRICVVNQDEGGESSLTGEINVGDMIVANLQENTQLGWQFTNEEDALEEVRSGKSYAAFIIGQDFTANLLSITTGDFTQPTIEYYVNEKANAVSPKVTDAGANTLDRTINSTFVETVSTVVVEKLSDVIATAEGEVGQAGSTASTAITQAQAALQRAGDALSSLAQMSAEGSANAESAQEELAKAKEKLDYLDELLSEFEAANDGATIAGLQSAISKEQALVRQLDIILGQSSTTLSTTSGALSQTTELIDSLEQELSTIKADIVALSVASTWGQLGDVLSGDGLDASKIGEFMKSPTTITTENLYSLEAYGMAMAPLFMNLTFWIGAFMLLVIIKQEVDGEGIRNMTAKQSYLARWLLLSGLAAIQAVVCCTGVLAIGVSAANVPALYLAAIVCSLAYLSIMFALSSCLQHVGKGLCLILVFIQIPACTGIYPTEMTTGFFQAIYRVFPFTYGIDAMREALFGFYGLTYGESLIALLIFLGVFLLIGLLLRPFLSNVNRLFARQIASSGILNGEDIQVPERRFRFSQLVRAVADREEYRAYLEKRTRTMLLWYPRVKVSVIAASFALLLVAMGVLRLIGGDWRELILTLWVVWLVLTMAVFIVGDYLRDSISRQLALGDMGEAELRSAFREFNLRRAVGAMRGKAKDSAEEAPEERDSGENAAEPSAEAASESLPEGNGGRDA